jgi:hypothetical protein
MNSTGLNRSTNAQHTHAAETSPAATKFIVAWASEECETGELTRVEDGRDETFVAGVWAVEGFVETGGDIDGAQNSNVVTKDCQFLQVSSVELGLTPKK